MTVVFHARPRRRFMEIMNNSEKKKLHRTNQRSNFLGGSFIDGTKEKNTLASRNAADEKNLHPEFFFFFINLIEIFK